LWYLYKSYMVHCAANYRLSAWTSDWKGSARLHPERQIPLDFLLWKLAHQHVAVLTEHHCMHLSHLPKQGKTPHVYLLRA